MKNNKSNSVLQIYTDKETHLAIKKVAALERLSCSKLCERLIIPYLKNYLEAHEKEVETTAKKLRELRGY